MTVVASSMTLPSPAEQLASRKRLKAVFYTQSAKVAPKIVAFIEDPNAPRCDWPCKVEPCFAETTRATVGIVQRTVCDYFGVSYRDLVSARRTGDIVIPRQVAIYLARKMTGKSLPLIANSFGGRDHTTALYAVRKISSLRESDLSFASTVHSLKCEIERRCELSLRVKA